MKYRVSCLALASMLLVVAHANGHNGTHNSLDALNAKGRCITAGYNDLPGIVNSENNWVATAEAIEQQVLQRFNALCPNAQNHADYALLTQIVTDLSYRLRDLKDQRDYVCGAGAGQGMVGTAQAYYATGEQHFGQGFYDSATHNYDEAEEFIWLAQMGHAQFLSIYSMLQITATAADDLITVIANANCP